MELLSRDKIAAIEIRIALAFPSLKAEHTPRLEITKNNFDKCAQALDEIRHGSLYCVMSKQFFSP